MILDQLDVIAADAIAAEWQRIAEAERILGLVNESLAHAQAAIALMTPPGDAMTTTARPPLYMSCGCIWQGDHHETRTHTCPRHTR